MNKLNNRKYLSCTFAGIMSFLALLSGFNIKSLLAKRPRIQDIITAMKKDSPEVRKAAGDQLYELGKKGLSPKEGLIALKAAAGEFPPREYDFQDSATELVRAAAVNPKPDYIPVIVELYPKYNDHAKGAALTLLSKLGSRDALTAWLHLIRLYAPEGGVPALNIWHLKLDSCTIGIIFPELLDYANIPTLSYDVYMLCLTYIKKGLLRTEELIHYANQLLETYRFYKNDLIRAQQSEGISWMWTNEYQERRSAGALYLDLMGYFPTNDVKTELGSALTYLDLKLKYFAVTSLLRLGEDVDASHILDVARSAEMRNFLYNELEKLELELYPEAYKTQKAFAESEMVNWLVYPTELGRVPDEIELMKVVEIDTGTRDGVIEYYVYRFRTFEPHWAAEYGWVAGVSGPFILKDAPSTVAYGDTFSSFEPWDCMSPEEHVGNIQEIINRWKE